MAHNKEIIDSQIFLKLVKLIEEAPDFGVISIQIFFHDGEINRIKTSKEVSIQLHHD